MLNNNNFQVHIDAAGFAPSVLTTALLLAGTAVSQPSLAADREIEELVVTAQKREESSQDIGIAITTLDEDRIVTTNVNNIQDLQNMAPSLQIGESFGFAQIMVRGIGTDNPFAGGDPSVGMHIDGVITGQSSAQFGSLFDIDRIEVLRGPQGTLYGRNTTGGSINVITNRPTEETTGYARLTTGNYSLVKFEGAAGGSLSDNLQGRVAVRTLERDGYGENIATGNDIDDADQQSFRVQLLWMPTENSSIRLAYEHHDEDDTNYMPKFRSASYDPAPLPALEPQPTDAQRASDPRDLNSNVNLQNDREQQSLTLEYNWDINRTLSLTSLTNQQSFEKIPQADFDMTADDFYIWSESFETDQFSEELRLNFQSDRVQGLAGLYYYREEINNSENRLDIPLVPQAVADSTPPLAGCGFDDNVSDQIIGMPPEDLCFHFRGETEAEAWAFFTSVAYDLSDVLTLNAGLRYSDETREGDTDRWTAPGAPVLTFADKRSFDDLSPSLRLEWDAAADIMLYASYSEGFKSGIFLAGQRSPVLDPETVETWEAGMKGTFLNRTLQLNAAMFHNDFTDLQQGRSVPAGSSGFTLVYENAASADISGVETEFTWLATENLSIDGSATWLDATFDDYVTTDPFDTVFQQLGLIDPDVDLSRQLAGNRMVQSPEWALSLGANLDIHHANGWQSSIRLSAAYKDEVQFSQFNHDALSQDSVTTVDANWQISSLDGRWTLNAWGKNLTDETIYVGTFILNSSRTNAGFLAPPRTWGLTLGYNF